MLKSIIKYSFIFLISVFVVYQFQGTIGQLRLIPKGIVKLIFPEKKIKPSLKSDNLNGEIEIINANSFEVHFKKMNYFSGFNKDEEDKVNPQHKSSALYGFKKKDKTHLELYTRNGFLVTKQGIKKFKLPNNFDSHNSAGGIRGVFFINEERYAFLSTIKIGCQNVTIINLDRNIEIFDTDCLPDYQDIHYDGIGGASIHNKDNVLLSIGAPTNSSQQIRDLAQKDDSFYGKIILINKKNIQSFLENNEKIKTKIYTKGHRNPQGLANIGNKFFSAEHGPKGGDEINILKANKNYGWPISSYGTKYESLATASYKLNHLKNNFEEPLLQFTPSLAISDLSNCTKEMIFYFNRKGCLIGTTLKEKSLIIILLDHKLERVIGYELIEFGERLRHFAKNIDGRLFTEKDGSIYITSDSGEVYKVYFNFKKE
jgi:hypothetical protein